ncbi:MAG: hypothetical protein NE327_16910 [Lentisphaeraceae bacterium]|nr:hypothetical protein [Lentisphaeraceae bacterium]
MKDHEITEELINALNNSQDGFTAFKKMFNDCANAFEVGKDAEGLQIIKDLIQPLQDFCYFCADVLSTHAHMIADDKLDLLKEQCESLESLMGELVKEMEDGNYVEVGDILKYDFGDLTSQMSKIFPEVAESIQSYQVSESC